MADTVRYIAEEMIPELEDFEKRQYFTKAEIKQMVKKRLQFEYLLKRKVPLKADFLRYIQYEEKLEALRLHRKDAKGMAGKHTLSEWAIPRRIHFIYDRALRRFKGDLDLWTRWLQHCRAAGSPRQLSKVLTRALQLHPTEPRLWSHAAGFEFEDHHNPAAARLLLQRGLRICPNSIPLWLENFRLELLYAHQLRTRRQVLGLEPGATRDTEVRQPDPLGDAPELAAAAAPHSRHGDQDPMLASQPEFGRADSEDAAELDAHGDGRPNGHVDHGSILDSLPQEPAGGSHPPVIMFDAVGGSPSLPGERTREPHSSDDAAFQMLLEGGIARVVFRNAAEAHPLRLELRSQLLKTLRPFTFPGVASLSQEILADVAQRFPHDPEAWDLRARASWDPIGQPPAHAVLDGQQRLQMAIAVYEEAVQQLERQEMYRLYAAFLQERLAEQTASDNADKPPAMSTVDLLCTVHQQAADKGLASEEMLLDWAALHMGQGRPEAAAAATMQGCQLLPASCALWQRRLALLAQSAATQVSQAGSKKERRQAQRAVQEAAEAAVGHVPALASAPLWLQLFPAFQALALPCSPLAHLLLTQLMTLAKGSPQSAMGEAAAAAVRAVWSQDGPDAARQLYRRILALPPPGLAVFNAILDLEMVSEASSPSKQGPVQIQQVFEAAVDAYGQTDVKLWIRYIQHQQHMVQGSGSLYWRACKQLQDADAFVAAFNSLQQVH